MCGASAAFFVSLMKGLPMAIIVIGIDCNGREVVRYMVAPDTALSPMGIISQTCERVKEWNPSVVRVVIDCAI